MGNELDMQKLCIQNTMYAKKRRLIHEQKFNNFIYIYIYIYIYTYIIISTVYHIRVSVIIAEVCIKTF